MSKLPHSKGYTLISLMVGMLIGIFIIGAAGEVYIQSKNSFNARAAVSSMTENGRFAIQDLRRTLVMAGMGIRASEAISPTLRAIPPISGSGTAVGAGQYPDVVAVRYRRGPSCGGFIDNTFPLAPATVRFLVVNEQLMCQVDGGPTQPLVSGVKTMKALYGVDDSADGYANRYLNATQVNASGQWINIVSIRVGLVIDSAEYNQPYDVSKTQLDHILYGTANYDLNLLGMVYSIPPVDGSDAGMEKTYNVFTTTIQLRNLNAIMQKQ